MAQWKVRRILVVGMLAASWSVLVAQPGPAQAKQARKAGLPGSAATPTENPDLPDAQRTKRDLTVLLSRYPPAVKGVLALDPSLLVNQSYLAPYPALAKFIKEHPEIIRDPSFYVGGPPSMRGGPDENAPRPTPSVIYAPATARGNSEDYATRSMQMWQQTLGGLAVFLGFGMAIGLVTWLIRTWLDYRRWSNLAKVQADVHTKLLDRFTANEELLAYIQSPAGSKFLESSPIALDAGAHSVGAPLGRILWSIQAGVVLAAAGIGLMFVSGHVSGDAAQPFHAMGILGIALGIGFAISAIISFAISYRLGLVDLASPAHSAEPPNGSA